VHFGPDGRTLLTVTLDHAQLWDAVTGSPKGPAEPFTGYVFDTVFTEDGPRFVTVDWRNFSVQVHGMETSDALTLELQLGMPIYSVSLSRNGRWLATGAGSFARVWNARTGDPVTPPLDQGQLVRSIAIDDDGTLLVVGLGSFRSKRGSARVWDVATAQPLTPAFTHPVDVTFVVLSSNGRQVLTTDEAGAARIWDIAPAIGPLEVILRQGALLSGQTIDANGTQMLLSPNDALRAFALR
jgi:WD40 repeat protein